MLATAGTSAAVGEVARLLPPGSRVAVEDPGYSRAVAALRDAGVEVVPVPVDDDGLVVDALPAGLAAVYCTPAHQFPTGRRMTAARRLDLVARARAEGWWVLEDDYDGELRFDVAPLPLLGALAPDVVVHLGTSSKILSPTLGVGWLVAPAPVRAGLLARRTATAMRPARAGQRVLAALAALRRSVPAPAPAAAGDGRPAGARADGGHRCGVRRRGRPRGRARPRAAGRRRRGGGAGRPRRAPLGLALDGLGRHHLADGPGRRAGLVLGFAAPTRAELDRALPVLDRAAARVDDDGPASPGGDGPVGASRSYSTDQVSPPPSRPCRSAVPPTRAVSSCSVIMPS